MGMIMKKHDHDTFTFEDEYGKVFQFTYEEVRSMTVALLTTNLHEDAKECVDQVIDEEEIDLSKVADMTAEKFLSEVEKSLRHYIEDDLTEPCCEIIFDHISMVAQDLGVKA